LLKAKYEEAAKLRDDETHRKELLLLKNNGKMKTNRIEVTEDNVDVVINDDWNSVNRYCTNRK
jgi:hypothetical protein